MDALKTILAVFGAYCLVGPALSVWVYFRDRSGNSGRSGHWSKNPRIKKMDEQ